MDVPSNYRKEVIKWFGKKGELWLEKLPKIIYTVIERWSITDFEIVENLSINFLGFGKSKQYGDVVIKICGPHPEKYTEIKSLTIFNGNNFCNCYDYDMELGAILLERILPGADLKTITNRDLQLKIASELISKTPMKVESNYGIPTFGERANKAFKRARKENKVGERMLEFIDLSEVMISEIEQSNRAKYLLHGDLHHLNILKDKKGNWKAIDPHGVIGVPCMESSRFIQNHIWMSKDKDKLNDLDKIITVFSEKFNETKEFTAICFFILQVLSTCWSFEEVKPDLENLEKDIDLCEFALNYIKSLN